jgi:hypothetical protein
MFEVSGNGIDWISGKDIWLPIEVYPWHKKDGIIIKEPPEIKPLKKFVRIGANCGPRIVQNDDRWGQPVNSFYVEDWCVVEPELWDRIQKYEAPLEDDAQKILDKGYSLDEYTKTISKKISDQMIISGSLQTLWQMDVRHRPDSNYNDFRRIVAAFGSMHKQDSVWRKREWSWYECFVLRPLMLIKCEALNKKYQLLENKIDGNS